jgi:hypothetical protein
MCGGGCSGVSHNRPVHRSAPFQRPDMPKQKPGFQDDDVMEGMRADDMKKKTPAAPPPSVVDTVKRAIGGIVNTVKKAVTPPPAVVTAPPATAPVSTRPNVN